jgi:hypothetical protein
MRAHEVQKHRGTHGYSRRTHGVLTRYSRVLPRCRSTGVLTGTQGVLTGAPEVQKPDPERAAWASRAWAERPPSRLCDCAVSSAAGVAAAMRCECLGSQCMPRVPARCRHRCATLHRHVASRGATLHVAWAVGASHVATLSPSTLGRVCCMHGTQRMLRVVRCAAYAFWPVARWVGLDLERCRAHAKQ